MLWVSLLTPKLYHSQQSPAQLIKERPHHESSGQCTFLFPLISVPPTILRHRSTRRLRIDRFLISPTLTRFTQNLQSASMSRGLVRFSCRKSIDKVSAVNELYSRKVTFAVRSPDIEVGFFSPNATVKERLCGKLARCREMIDQIIKTTEELQIKMESVIDAVLAQINYSSNDLTDFNKTVIFSKRSIGLSA